MALKELDATPDLRDNPALKDFTELSKLAQSFIDTKAFVGSSIRPPGPDATPAARQEFYDKLIKHAPDLVPLREGDAEADKLVWNRLGRPADANGYEFKAPDDVPVDLAALRVEALATGMTKGQFAKRAELEVTKTRASIEAASADNKALRTEWGQAYDSKLKDAAAAAAKLNAPEAFVKLIQDGKLSSSQLKLWDSLAKSLGTEGNGIGRQTGSPAPGTPTPAEAEAQIQEIMADPAYWKAGDPRHAGLVQKVMKLQALITPD